MRFIVLGLVCLAALTANADKDLRQVFKDWKVEFNRNYGGGLRNELARFRQFKKSAQTIEYINSIQSDWVAGFTLFADMTDEEKAAFTGLKLNDTELESNLEIDPSPLDPTDPEKQYWDMGPVKNQWSCGSCWAFAAVGAMEGRHLKEHGEFRDFSEQTLLDCTFEGRRDGCTGGWSELAINWAGADSKISHSKFYGYLPIRQDNEYRWSDGECTDLKKPYNNALRRAKPLAYLASYRSRNDAGLQHALATEGPVEVDIYSSWALPFYTTGTYRGDGCGTDPTPNHAVVVAGYEKDYWYVKNSWGSWGYSGYAYFSRGWENLCSISARRKTMEWRPNNEWKICTDTHPSERTPCDSSANLNQEVCQSRGCCYDSNYSGTATQCFIKGKVTIYDEEGKKRVLYTSAEEFSQFEFSYYGKAAQVEIGSWKLFVSADYYGDYKMIKPEDGQVTFDFQSIQILNI